MSPANDDRPTTKTDHVDFRQLRALLRAYFLMGSRGNAFRGFGANQENRSVGWLFAFYFAIGLMISLSSAAVGAFEFCLIVHAVTFVVVGATVTTEAGDILFNANETDVLLHRPIAPATLLLAKVLHVMVVGGLIAGAVNVAPLVAMLWVQEGGPLVSLVHVVSTGMLVAFCGSAVIIAYGAVMRVFGRERFDSVATWSQVALSVLFMVGYQALPRIMTNLKGVLATEQALLLLPLPFAWSASLDMAASGRGAPVHWLMATVGLFATSAIALFAVRKLASLYAEAWETLRETPAPRKPARRVAASEASCPRVIAWWLKDPVERVVFRLTAAYLWRDRDVRLRLYPSLAPFLFLPVMWVFMGDSFLGPFMTAMLALLPMAAIEALRQSAHYAASEIFLVAPLRSAAPLFHGVRKAVLWYLFAPTLLATLILQAIMSRGRLEAMILTLPILVLTPVLSLSSGALSQYAPLSEPVRTGRQSGLVQLLSLGSMLVSFAVLGIFWWAQKVGVFWIALAVEAFIAALLYRLFCRVIRNRPLAGATL